MKFLKKHKKLFIAVGATIGTILVVRQVAKSNLLTKIPFIGGYAQKGASLL